MTTNNAVNFPPGTLIKYSGNLVLLSTQAASSSATIDFTGLTSTYSVYQIELSGVQPANDAVDLYINYGTGAGPSWDTGNNYTWSVINANSSAGTGGRGGAADTKIIVNSTLNLDSGSTSSFNGIFRFYNTSSASLYKAVNSQAGYISSNGTTGINTTSFGTYLSATAATGIRFSMSAGNIAVGTFNLYGVI